MLLCKYCNYYIGFDDSVDTNSDNKAASNKVGICKYTDFIFTDDPDYLDTEYPCNKK
jgi:hypothetical protein